jgi:hypothetical protein
VCPDLRRGIAGMRWPVSGGLLVRPPRLAATKAGLGRADRWLPARLVRIRSNTLEDHHLGPLPADPAVMLR